MTPDELAEAIAAQGRSVRIIGGDCADHEEGTARLEAGRLVVDWDSGAACELSGDDIEIVGEDEA